MKGTGFSPYINAEDESPLDAEGCGIVRKPGPQRLKPGYFCGDYVRAEARTLQEQSFSATCEARTLLKVSFPQPLRSLIFRPQNSRLGALETTQPAILTIPLQLLAPLVGL